MSKRLRYTAFALLYLAQGSIMAFFTALNGIYLRGLGVPMSRIGVISAIGMIPFVVKIFLGMISDRINLQGWGHRKPYIVIGVLGQAGMLLLIPFIHPQDQFVLYCAAVLGAMTSMALYDTCTDGLAIDTTPVEEEGTVQGIMVAGRALGVVAISALIGVLANQSWVAVFVSLAALTLVPLPLVFFLKENSEAEREPFQWKAFRAFSQRMVWAVLLFGTFNSVVAYGANQLVNPFLREHYGITNAQAGLMTATWGVGVIIGGMAGGRLLDRIGRRRMAFLAVILAAVTIGLLGTISSLGMAWPLALLFGIAFGAYDALFFALAMGVCQPGIEASMYALLMAGANVGSGVGMALSGALADSPGLGYRGAFGVLAVLNVLVLATVPLMFGWRQGRQAQMEASAGE